MLISIIDDKTCVELDVGGAFSEFKDMKEIIAADIDNRVALKTKTNDILLK